MAVRANISWCRRDLCEIYFKTIISYSVDRELVDIGLNLLKRRNKSVNLFFVLYLLFATQGVSNSKGFNFILKEQKSTKFYKISNLDLEQNNQNVGN